MSIEAVPRLTYDDAMVVGDALHDHLARAMGSSPFPRGDLRLADTVQLIMWHARERVVERRET